MGGGSSRKKIQASFLRCATTPCRTEGFCFRIWYISRLCLIRRCSGVLDPLNLLISASRTLSDVASRVLEASGRTRVLESSESRAGVDDRRDI